MHILLPALLVLSLAQISHSLVTLCAIRNLTSLTDDYLARITGDEVFHLQHSDVKEYVLAAGWERDSVEEVSPTLASRDRMQIQDNARICYIAILMYSSST
jgi:hypothetical protein